MVRVRIVKVLLPTMLVMLSMHSIGCSERTAMVSGVVVLDGSPIKIEDSQRGMLVFRPVAGGATCTGLIGADGTFRVASGASSGVVPGDYMVSARVIEMVPAEEVGQQATGTPITPAVYADPLTSGLVYSISSGGNQLRIELDSSAGPAVLPPPVVEESDGEASEETDGELANEEGGAVEAEVGDEKAARLEETQPETVLDEETGAEAKGGSDAAG